MLHAKTQFYAWKALGRKIVQNLKNAKEGIKTFISSPGIITMDCIVVWDIIEFRIFL